MQLVKQVRLFAMLSVSCSCFGLEVTSLYCCKNAFAYQLLVHPVCWKCVLHLIGICIDDDAAAGACDL